MCDGVFIDAGSNMEAWSDREENKATLAVLNVKKKCESSVFYERVDFLTNVLFYAFFFVKKWIFIAIWWMEDEIIWTKFMMLIHGEDAEVLMWSVNRTSILLYCRVVWVCGSHNETNFRV